MTKKIFRSTVAVGLAVLLASLVIIMGALYTYFGHVQEQQLRDELSIAAAAMESGDGEAYLSKLHSDNYRITWLRADGTVLYDTKADAAAMENHAQREEVRQALANGAGESSRYSNTMLTKMLYYAQRLPDGTVLRLFLSHPGTAYTRDRLMELVWGMDYCGESRTVDMHIRTLRKKLGDAGRYICTVRKVGYKLTDEEAEEE